MLESLTLENFQKHQRLHIDFDPHVSVLVGSSDAGKSACIRSLYWIMTNQLRGDYFIHHGADSARGTLKIDGHTIVREKGKGVNLYQVDGGTPYEAFGTGVPEDIEKLVNICRTNFQLQLDAPFLFGLSPGDISKELNSVVNLDLIDSVLSHLSGEHRKAKTSVQVSEERLEQAKTKRDELRWAKEADTLLKELEGIDKELDQGRQEVAKLKDVIRGLEEVDETLAGADQTIIVMEALIEVGNACQQTMSERDALAGLLGEIEAIDKRIDIAIEDVRAREESLRDKLEGKCPICGSSTKEIP